MCKDSVVALTSESFSGLADKSCMSPGQCLSSVLLAALAERRLAVGLPAAVRHLRAGREALFVVTVGASPSADSATHLLAVLLRAFCAEHHIRVLEVDSDCKLKRLLGVSSCEPLGCVLVRSPYADPFRDLSVSVPPLCVSPAERSLLALCTEGAAPPLVRLPDK
ncbi:unnamed protein product [Danaus chrysippus]|uniref:(African queen) hypothetical protein n=1 Tax=Danaus chrysippus TaxID=151541 RepID=A0A8J2QR47_9NEOP|nr:unnamed protein product [Danaus chrysippus]